MANLLGVQMKKYIIEPNEFTNNEQIIITRDEIKLMKKKCISGGNVFYNHMLNVLRPKVALARASMIPGTKILIWVLNACIFAVRILIVTAIILLFYKLWVISLITFGVVYLLSTPIQTAINYEIAARLFVFDQKLDIESELDLNFHDYL